MTTVVAPFAILVGFFLGILILAVGVFAMKFLLSMPGGRHLLGLMAGLALLAVPLATLFIFKLRASRSVEQSATEIVPAAPTAIVSPHRVHKHVSVLHGMGQALQAGFSTQPPASKPVASPPALVAERPSLAAEAPENSSPRPRPAWVDARPGRVGDAYQMTTVVGPYSTRLECDQELPNYVQAALAGYTEICLGSEAASRVQLPWEELAPVVKDQWEETVQVSIGPMVQLHVLLDFDRNMQQRVKDQWRQVVVQRRLVYAGVGLAGVLALLALLYGGLRIDHATRGARRSRLAAAAVVLAAVGVGVWVLTVELHSVRSLPGQVHSAH
ncbi:MAG: hypothetical protein ABSG68_02760 [Thermoguttaceae bacterium]|jgi:hypothetical protein